MRREHRHDMEGPPRITPTGLADYLDVLSKSVFQSGMSWRVVDAKWAGTREAFFGFDPVRLIDLTPDEVDELARDTRLIRNRRKIEATIHNAQTMLDLDQQHQGFKRYLEAFANYDALSADLIKRFKLLRKTGTYFFLYVVGEPVPNYHEVIA